MRAGVWIPKNPRKGDSLAKLNPDKIRRIICIARAAEISFTYNLKDLIKSQSLALSKPTADIVETVSLVLSGLLTPGEVGEVWRSIEKRSQFSENDRQWQVYSDESPSSIFIEMIVWLLVDGFKENPIILPDVEYHPVLYWYRDIIDDGVLFDNVTRRLKDGLNSHGVFAFGCAIPDFFNERQAHSLAYHFGKPRGSK